MESNLTAMLDSLCETGIYVIEQDTKKLLYYNKKFKKLNPKAEIGKKCCQEFCEMCSDCPVAVIGDGDFSHRIHYLDSEGNAADLKADRIVWEGSLPAFMITITPHKLNNQGKKGIEKIEEIYRKSLVTVFNECIIANLTTDYFVNCQKDMAWTDIPERGQFGAENRQYSKLTIHPDDLEVFENHFSREALLNLFEQGRRQISKQLRRRVDDGTYHMMEFTATKIQSLGEDVWCVLIHRDINEDYLAEQKRNLEVSQLAAAVRSTYEILISGNLTKNTYYIMERDPYLIKGALNYGRLDDLEKLVVSTINPVYRDEFIRRFSRKALLKTFDRGISNVSMELRQMGEDGVYHWISTQVVRVNSPHTDDVLEITMTKNIDEERRIQEENLVKERNAKLLLKEALDKTEAANNAKSDFLSKMSHDIRTPMNAILGMTTLAQLHIKDEKRLAEYLKKIQISGKHLLGLINEVLDVSKIESGNVQLCEEEFDLFMLVKEVALMVQPSLQGKEQELTVNLPGIDSITVVGDAQKLRQILLNLLENASKYTGNKGKIKLSLEEIKKDTDFMSSFRFRVEDNGIGMKQEYLDHIFEPFSRADDSRISKIPGTGLGLTIVYNLVSMMRGSLQVSSEYGKGSCFTLTLCMVKKQTLHHGDKQPNPMIADSFAGLKILLVEDNELNQQIAAEMLNVFQVDIECAENGTEAVQMIWDHPPLYYDLVFMDIQMPVMDGYQAAIKIRNLKKERINELPIIAMTADAFSEDIKKAKLAGMNGHISKPIDLDKLKESLEFCVHWKEKNGAGEKGYWKDSQGFSI